MPNTDQKNLNSTVTLSSKEAEVLKNFRAKIAEAAKISNSYTGLSRDFLIVAQETLGIKILSGLIAICSSCKDIRSDENCEPGKGDWEKIETYISEHSEGQFSHGICPCCVEKLYGGEDWYIEMKKEKAEKNENQGE
jgi:hypothetical protein